MKTSKIICLLLSLVFSLNVIPFTVLLVSAQDINSCEVGSFKDCVSDFWYDYGDEGVQITRYDGNGGIITIPSSISEEWYDFVHKIGPWYEERPVHGLSGLFNEKISGVIIPSFITSISAGSFYGCSSLEYIMVDNNNAVYDSRENCNAIIETLSNELICGCKATVIPSSIESIGHLAFAGSTGLTEITILENVTDIKDDAFCDCDELTIYGIKNSEAERYANAHGFFFVPLDGDSKLDIEVSSWEAFDESNNQWQYPVKDYEYALGNFAWNKQYYDLNTNSNLIDRTNYDKLFLKVELEHKGDSENNSDATHAEVELTAPNGFSFSKNELITKHICTFEKLKQGEKQSKAVIIYPIFSLAYQDGQEIIVGTKVSSTLYDESLEGISIGTIHKRENEGMISISDTNKMQVVSITPEMFAQSPYNYVQQLAQLGIDLSSMEYCTDRWIEDSYRNLGFSNIRIYGDATGYANINNVNFSFASKRIVINNKIYTIIVAPVRGTVNFNEWIGNADAFVKANGDHRSFRNAANDVRYNLEWYIRYTDSCLAGEHKLFLTGHSRGAAVANLLGADIDNDHFKTYFSGNNTYVYTFATPNTTNDYYISHERFNNIFNIIDYNDIVATVPPRFMGYNKYGRTYSFALDSHLHSYLPTIVNSVNNLYYSYSGKEYNPLSEIDRINYTYDLSNSILGIVRGTPWEKVRSALSVWLDSREFADRAICTHSPTNYIAWMESLHNQNEMMFSEINYKRIEVQCPVDVEIIDSKGKTVGKTNNGTLNESVSNQDGVLLAIDNEHKIIVLPDIDDYTIKTTGYDEGSMNITVVDYQDFNKEKVTCYNNKPIDSGKQYSLQMPEDSYEYQLRTDSGILIDPDKVYDKEQLDKVNISVTVSGNGKVEGDGSYTPGEIAVLIADQDNGDFIGWYIGDKLISNQPEYSFIVSESCGFIAKFSKDSKLVLGDTDGDCNVEIRDATWIQRYAATIDIPFSISKTTADVDGDDNITVMDATAIQYYLCHLKILFPIGTIIS